MKELELKIDEAAFDHSTDPNNKLRWNAIMMDSFIKGAKSNEAKEYWQLEMYSKEEVEERMRLAIISANEIYSKSMLINDWIKRNIKKGDPFQKIA